jgi:hypothetical protein
MSVTISRSFLESDFFLESFDFDLDLDLDFEDNFDKLDFFEGFDFSLLSFDFLDKLFFEFFFLMI